MSLLPPTAQPLHSSEKYLGKESDTSQSHCLLCQIYGAEQHAHHYHKIRIRDLPLKAYSVLENLVG